MSSADKIRFALSVIVRANALIQQANAMILDEMLPRPAAPKRKPKKLAAKSKTV